MDNVLRRRRDEAWSAWRIQGVERTFEPAAHPCGLITIEWDNTRIRPKYWIAASTVLLHDKPCMRMSLVEIIGHHFHHEEARETTSECGRRALFPSSGPCPDLLYLLEVIPRVNAPAAHQGHGISRM
jgi:hypothetical protein